MVGRGIAVAGIWLGVGFAIGISGSARPSLPFQVYQWLLVCAVLVTWPIVLPLMGPWSWKE
jgi:hypothetical protein